MLVDSLKDLVRHTYGLGFIDTVKVVSTETETKIEAIDVDKTVVIYGTTYQPMQGLDSTVGLSRIGVLRGYIDFPAFNSDKSSIEVIKQTRNGSDVPVELRFDSGNKHTANYRFMSEEMANEQIKVPPFKGATWNVTIMPTKNNMKDLSYFSGVLGSFESTFTVSVDNGTLFFGIGTGPTDRTMLPFATDITGTLKHQWSWPLAQVLSILKLADTGDYVMKFSDMGAMQIDIDSGVAKYSYIIPARSK